MSTYHRCSAAGFGEYLITPLTVEVLFDPLRLRRVTLFEVASIRWGAVNLAGAQRDRGVQGLGGLGVGGMGQAAAVSPVTSFQTANRRVISVR